MEGDRFERSISFLQPGSQCNSPTLVMATTSAMLYVIQVICLQAERMLEVSCCQAANSHTPDGSVKMGKLGGGDSRAIQARVMQVCLCRLARLVNHIFNLQLKVAVPE